MRVPEFELALEKHSEFFITLNRYKIHMEDNDRGGGNRGARETWVYKLLNKNLYIVPEKYDNISAKLVDGHWKVTAPTSIKEHSKEEIIAGFEELIDKFMAFNQNKYDNRVEWKREGNTSLINTVDQKSKELNDFDVSDIELGLKPRRSDAGLLDLKVRTNQGSFYIPGNYYIEGLDIELLDDKTWQVEVSESNSYKPLSNIDSLLKGLLEHLIVELEKKRAAEIKKDQPKGW
ncbi:hypothetical protein [Reichenbachiella versicolor]|uniref:hypothetical protein n=1 Tax=Reichenbachiella versicolor TaxID=1821036 RepID=UPI000D6E593F|nr:hypothetical protein [Reichenbachiella versicolor]